MKRLNKQLRKSIAHVLRWHRKIGLTLVLAILVLVVTGILLNHSPGLKLASTSLTTPWLNRWYGIETYPPTGFQLGQYWLIQPGGNTLFFNQRETASCQPPLRGAASYQSMVLALCEDALLILDSEGQLIESFGAVQGLPSAITKLQVRNDEILLGSHTQSLSLDMGSLQTTPRDPVLNGWSEPSPIPDNLLNDLREQVELPGISLEKLLLDIHSGRIFGAFGVLLVDLVGILLSILSLTGVWAWYSRNKLRKSTE